LYPTASKLRGISFKDYLELLTIIKRFLHCHIRIRLYYSLRCLYYKAACLHTSPCIEKKLYKSVSLCLSKFFHVLNEEEKKHISSFCLFSGYYLYLILDDFFWCCAPPIFRFFILNAKTKQNITDYIINLIQQIIHHDT
jgi:hypothetical protein